MPDLRGQRLKPEALGVTIDGRDISEVAAHVDHATRSRWAEALPERD